MADEFELEPTSRKERYYSAIANGDIIDLKPIGREERFLHAIANRPLVSGSGGGTNGLSTYEIAIKNGFEGTEKEWLESLKGKDGYTPQKGTDYYTPAERQSIVDEVTENLRVQTTSILQAVYPVGSIYISMNNINPALVFGFGTWEQRKDRYIVGAGDYYAAGSIGGEAFHTLTMDEMPAHNHGSGALNAMGNIGLYEEGGTGGYGYTIGWGTLSPRTDLAIYVTENGDNQPFNNNPPYFAAYIWQRIS